MLDDLFYKTSSNLIRNLIINLITLPTQYAKEPKEISKKKVLKYADCFSDVMRKELIDKKYIIDETLSFIKDNYKKYPMHIVSGAEEKELQYLCEQLDLDRYFLSIKGSPIIKSELIKNLLKTEKYKAQETVMIGDSINDYDAAKANNLKFMAYNNKLIKKKSDFEYEMKYSGLLRN